jgi:hypothetical protein
MHGQQGLKSIRFLLPALLLQECLKYSHQAWSKKFSFVVKIVFVKVVVFVVILLGGGFFRGHAFFFKGGLG